MKRALTSITALAVAAGTIGLGLASPAERAPKLTKWQQEQQHMVRISAPGDEYFGRMKMSFLGIGNTFHDDFIRAGAYTTDSGIIQSVGFADEALQDWTHKYPQDPQLPRAWFLAMQAYEKIYTRSAQEKAWNDMHEIERRWPKSYFGKLMAGYIKNGFTEHYFATPAPCATALAVFPLASSKPSPGPGLTPVPLPTPAAPPVGNESPQVDILPVPCFTPQPTPIATLAPTAAPTVAPATSPTGAPSALPSALPSGAPSALPSGAPAVSPTGAPSALPSG